MKAEKKKNSTTLKEILTIISLLIVLVFDPTRMPGFDPADASALARVVDQRLKDQAKKG